MGTIPPEPSGSSPFEYIAVGRVAKPHGLHGDVLVKVLTENPQRFAPGSVLLAGIDQSSLSQVEVAGAKPHQAGLRVQFEGYGDATAAERLRGCYLFVPADQLGRLAEGQYWEHELVGLRVERVDGTELGSLAAVVDRPGPDLWSIRTPGGEVLFPAARELVVEIDVPGGRVVIDPPEGLF